MSSFTEIIQKLQLFQEVKGINAIINKLCEIELGPVDLEAVESLRQLLKKMFENKAYDSIKHDDISLSETICDTLAALDQFDNDSPLPKIYFNGIEKNVEVKNNDFSDQKNVPGILTPDPDLKFSPDTDFLPISNVNSPVVLRINSDSSSQDVIGSDREKKHVVNLILKNYQTIKPQAYCENVTPWSQSSSLLQEVFGHVFQAVYDFFHTEIINCIHIEQYTKNEFGLRLVSYYDPSKRKTLLNALREMTYEDVRVCQFPDLNYTNIELKIIGNAHTIQSHLINIIAMIKNLEGDKVFSAEIEHEIRNVLPSAAPSATAYKLLSAPPQMKLENNSNNQKTKSNHDDYFPDQRQRDLFLTRFQMAAARGAFRIEQKAFKCLKDDTKAGPEDTNKLQIVLSRKNSSSKSNKK